MAGGTAWDTKLMRSPSTNAVIGNLANACTVLRECPTFKGRVVLNEHAGQSWVVKKLPWREDTNRPWDNVDDLAFCEWSQSRFIPIGVEAAQQAVERVAAERHLHPIRDYLGSLEWDTETRLDAWLSTYLGAESNEFSRAIGARWMVSAIARIFEPGCQADHTLILEGAQGRGKSTAMRVLGSPWFSDDVSEIGSKDASLQVRAAWIIELSELDALSKLDAHKIKAWMSRRVDSFRPPYGRRVIESPRQCVFVGTTNGQTYLKDETGGRRFWPVKVGHVDLDALKRDRDQLWAEALWQYREGYTWWLETMPLVGVAEQEQSDRFEGDAWTEKVLSWAGRQTDPNGVFIADVLTDALDFELKYAQQRDTNRVVRILTAAGYEQWRPYIKGERQRRYRRKEFSS